MTAKTRRLDNVLHPAVVVMVHLLQDSMVVEAMVDHLEADTLVNNLHTVSHSKADILVNSQVDMVDLHHHNLGTLLKVVIQVNRVVAILLLHLLQGIRNEMEWGGRFLSLSGR